MKDFENALLSILEAFGDEFFISLHYGTCGKPGSPPAWQRAWCCSLSRLGIAGGTVAHVSSVDAVTDWRELVTRLSVDMARRKVVARAQLEQLAGGS